jgi:hypothetical protein
MSGGTASSNFANLTCVLLAVGSLLLERIIEQASMIMNGSDWEAGRFWWLLGDFV